MYITSTSGVTRLAFDLLPWPQDFCLPGLSLVASALFRWPCNISIHLSPRSVTAGPPFSAGDATFLFIICFPGLSLAVSALFRWRCNISIHLFPRFVTAGVRPFPLAFLLAM